MGLGLGRFPQRREWLPTPVFWPGQFHGLYSLWSRKDSDMTEQHSLYFWTSLVARLVKNLPALQETLSWVGKIPRRRDKLSIPVFLGFPGGSAIKNPPAMWETWVRSLVWEDSLEKGTHSSILVWRIPLTEEPGRLLSMRSQSGMTEQFSLTYSIISAKRCYLDWKEIIRDGN